MIEIFHTHTEIQFVSFGLPLMSWGVFIDQIYIKNLTFIMVKQCPYFSIEIFLFYIFKTLKSTWWIKLIKIKL